jgi:hypothetical protein
MGDKWLSYLVVDNNFIQNSIKHRILSLKKNLSFYNFQAPNSLSYIIFN